MNWLLARVSGAEKLSLISHLDCITRNGLSHFKCVKSRKSPENVCSICHNLVPNGERNALL